MENREAPRKNLFFTTNLKYLRKSRGLSQEAFAQKLGLNRGNIVSYEKGSAEPNIRNLLRMAGFLGVTIEELIRFDFQNTLEDDQKHAPDRKIRHLPVALTEGEVKELVAKSQSLFAIIHGIGNYHALKSIPNEEHTQLNVEAMIVDIRRCVEVSEALVKVNQKILQSLNVNN